LLRADDRYLRKKDCSIMFNASQTNNKGNMIA